MVVMNNKSCTHAKKTEQANPLLNAAIFAAVALAVLPAAIFGAVRHSQSRTDASTKTVEVEETVPKRTSAAERRTQRLEARKAKEAKEAKTQDIYPEITMETVEPYYDGFGTDYDAGFEFNAPGMMPPVYMGAPGLMPAPYMAGPGMMPVPGRGDFDEFRRRPDAGSGFNNGFGGRRDYY